MQDFNFQNDVIDRSHEIPVVVDFWAPWCGPCRILGPVIEQLAEEQEGQWELVKLNTEEHPYVAQQYGIMSIPNVKMFFRGEEIADFVGALPRRSIEDWLDKNLPKQESLELEAILEQEQDVPDPRIISMLESRVDPQSGSPEGRVALARHLVFSDPKKAAEMVADIVEGHVLADEAGDIRILHHFFNTSFDEDHKVGKLLSKAQKAFQHGEREAGIQAIIDAAAIDKNYQDDLPRKTAIAFFRVWGNQHPLSLQYRRKFDMVLY